MAVRVVDFLEMIEIEHDQADLAPQGAGLLQDGLRVFQEMAAVGQPGQGIRFRLLPQGVPGLAQLRLDPAGSHGKDAKRQQSQEKHAAQQQRLDDGIRSANGAFRGV